MTCSAKKALTHENLSSALQITFHFMKKKHLSYTWAVLLKLHLAPFSHWERSFSASVALHSSSFASCTKHSISVLSSNSISVLRSSKPVILCIEALTWLALQKSSNTSKSVFYIANNISFHEKETYFIYLSFTLKIALATSLTQKEAFQHPWPCILFICLVALNTALVFLALTALVFLALKKSSKHENLSSALQITFHFIRKKHLSYTWALLLKLHLATFSHWERSFSASLALHSLHLLSCTKHSIKFLEALN